MKICTRCKALKPLDNFHKESRRSDGICNVCKLCRSEINHQSFIRNRSNRVKLNKAYRDSHPGWDAENQARYRRNHPDKVRVAHRQAQRRRYAAEGNHSETEWKELLEAFDYRCLACGISEKNLPDGRLHADHVIPISRGGPNYITNIQPLCPSCNRHKSIDIVDYRPSALTPRRMDNMIRI